MSSGRKGGHHSLADHGNTTRTRSLSQLSIDNLTSERDNAKRAVVALEQGNDDLEREHRNAHSSFLDIESKYNRLVEEMVLLEEDLRGKTALGEEVQRLKDVVRGESGVG
jgi:predicted  nucleic acid-binding Zn-ribbon protein